METKEETVTRVTGKVFTSERQTTFEININFVLAKVLGLQGNTQVYNFDDQTTLIGLIYYRVSKVGFRTHQYSTLYSLMIKKRYTTVVSVRSYAYLNTTSINMTVGHNKKLTFFLLVNCLYVRLFKAKAIQNELIHSTIV